jgi:hypothetical protein
MASELDPSAKARQMLGRVMVDPPANDDHTPRNQH